jgi:hypothetical protein
MVSLHEKYVSVRRNILYASDIRSEEDHIRHPLRLPGPKGSGGNGSQTVGCGGRGCGRRGSRGGRGGGRPQFTYFKRFGHYED